MDRVFKAYMDASSLLVKEAHGGLWAVYKEDAPEDLIGVLVSRFPVSIRSYATGASRPQ